MTDVAERAQAIVKGFWEASGTVSFGANLLPLETAIRDAIREAEEAARAEEREACAKLVEDGARPTIFDGDLRDDIAEDIRARIEKEG